MRDGVTEIILPDRMKGSALCREAALPLPSRERLARPVLAQLADGARGREAGRRQQALASTTASLLLTAAATGASAATLATG